MRKYIIGIDEVGRGPLAGPITLAAISARANSTYKILNSKLFKGIKDSKRLSEKRREEWFKLLTKNPKITYACASVWNSAIDKKGISYATRLAVKRVLKKLITNHQVPITGARILLDGGLKAPDDYVNQQTITKGDQKVPLIAAASIIAKVTRDRKMKRFARKYSAYGFEIHKGYGTRLHRDAIKTHGLCEIHRTSFCKNIDSFPRAWQDRKG